MSHSRPRGLFATTYVYFSVYCSAATRAMLLKLQRCSSRINFHQGLLEKEEITYKHQKRRLVRFLSSCLMWSQSSHNMQKSVPLQTPTDIELEPGNSIRVTLFDANHCPGAVMFRKSLAPVTPGLYLTPQCSRAREKLFFTPAISGVNLGTSIVLLGALAWSSTVPA